MIRHPLLLCLFVFGCGGSGIVETEDQPVQDTANRFVAAPSLGVTDWVKGDEFRLADATRVVLVEHWAT